MAEEHVLPATNSTLTRRTRSTRFASLKAKDIDDDDVGKKKKLTANTINTTACKRGFVEKCKKEKKSNLPWK